MPGKLEFSFNSNKLSEFILDKEVMTIGRKSDNDIRIENLAVSGHHAKLLTIFDDSFLEDLNSTNGTYVNGMSISKHPLKNGDIIVIGKHELRYINENRSIDNDDKTVLIRRPSEAISEPSTVSASTPGDEIPNLNIPLETHAFSSAKLQILNGKGAGKELPLVKSSVKLGKSGAEIAQINKRPDGHFILSLARREEGGRETHPLRVNGEEVGAHAVKLQNHDVIEISRIKIEYLLGS